jgi:uncharacterized metal-binding protein YceD (DUF177 family)
MISSSKKKEKKKESNIHAHQPVSLTLEFMIQMIMMIQRVLMEMSCHAKTHFQGLLVKERQQQEESSSQRVTWLHQRFGFLSDLVDAFKTIQIWIKM